MYSLDVVVVRWWFRPLDVGGLNGCEKKRNERVEGRRRDEILIAFHELPPSNVAAGSISATYVGSSQKKNFLPRSNIIAPCQNTILSRLLDPRS